MRSRNISFNLILWGSSVIKLGSAHNDQIEKQQIQHIEQAATFDMVQNFREPKKILFSCMVGGSSHVHWVLSILDELDSRGHNTSFITKEDHAKFSRSYPHIKTISVSAAEVSQHDDLMVDFSEASQLDLKVIITKVGTTSFEQDYPKMLELMKEEQYDTVLCDSFNTPCQEAAYTLNIPTIITSSMPQSRDSAAPYINNDMLELDIPTTEDMSFWQRVDVKLIRPLQFLWEIYDVRMKQNRILVASGSEPLLHQETRWKDSVKMYNTAFGIQRGRPLGPLVEFVGPIVKTKIPKLTLELERYLDYHQRVVYVAFGQNAVLSQSDVKSILTGLLEAYENKEIDGIIWSTRDLVKIFPGSITTQSNKTYDIKRIFSDNDHTDILFLSWAPQMAILNHPSLLFNINHGGSASIYESLYAGVKMIVYPFFGDQPAAAINAEKNGYGLGIHSAMTQDEITQIIKTIARDEGGKFKKSAERFKALVQIRSKHGVIKGADLVEEVLFLNDNGKITHRRDVKHDISFFKATNLDVYTFAVAFLFAALYSIFLFMNFIFSRYISSTNDTKQKII